MSWRQEWEVGARPSQTPYGLIELSKNGFEVFFPTVSSRGFLRRGAFAAERRLTGGLDWQLARRARKIEAIDAHVCWDERQGAATALLTSRSGPPTITGAIWVSDSAARGYSARIMRSGLQRAAGVWVLSKPQIPELVSRWQIPERRIFWLPFGIDADFWSRDMEERVGCAAEPDGLLSVISVGNDRHRDFATVRAAFNDGLHATARLKIVSAGEVTGLTAISSQSRSLSHTQLRAAYASSHVALLATRPNLHVSGMTFVLEAQAMGLPVVATETPGMSEYVLDGITGILVKPGDADAIRDALRGLHNDAALRAEMGERGRKFVLGQATTYQQNQRLSEIVRASVAAW